MKRFASSLVLCFVALGLQMVSPVIAAPVIADIQISPGATSTRIRLIASEAINISAFVLTAPDRLVIETPDINFQLPPDSGLSSEGAVKSYRYGKISADRARIVFDLASPLVPGDIVKSTSMGGGAYIVSLFLTAADRQSFDKAAQSSALSRLSKDAAPADIAALNQDSRPLIVIDPGHGGNDLGATGITGIFEKDVVLAFSIALAKKIEAQGQCRVLLTRDQDVFIPLDDRVKVARQHGAAVFLSIHGDTIASGVDVHGATVYVGDDRSSDAEAAKDAEYENKADSNGGFSPQPSDSTVADILGDLTLRETRTRSNLLARELVTRIADTAHLNRNPLRAAGFRVLRAVDVPSALVEIGYMSSKVDLDQLTSTEWTDRMTSRMTDALVEFLNPPNMAQDLAKP